MKLELNSNKIKHHAMLVLEENKALNDQLEFQKVKMTEIQKQHIHESKSRV